MITLQIAAGALLLVLLAVISQLPADHCCGRYPRTLGHVKGRHLFEKHHGYLIVLGFIPWWPVQALAIVIVLDDIVQHLIQLRSKNPSKPFAKSPLHRLAARVGFISPERP